MQGSQRTRRSEDGQVLVVFALALVGIIAMIGLVLDGGSVFAQRRDEQTVSDLASMAGATAYLNASGSTAARSAAADAAARTLATANGYTDGAENVGVNVTVSGTSVYATVEVQISKPHNNRFSGVVGMGSWDVTTSATAETSSNPNGVKGAMPLLFNEDAFPSATCDESSGSCASKIEVYQLPGTGNEDVPRDATQFNWTIFCQANGNPCNANSEGVRQLINQEGEEGTVFVDDVIAPLNAGSHTALFDALGAYVGGTFPVPVVCTVDEDDPNETCEFDGQMVGFAYFKLISVEGASDKVVRGYFVSPMRGADLVFNPDRGDASLNAGNFLLELID
jgi:Flp pilus assembly protein TadG